MSSSNMKRVIKSITTRLSGRSIIWDGKPSSDALYLTFDDGPRPGYTDVVLERLAAHGALATFFVLGEAVLQHQDIVKEIVSHGHAIGNHLFTHLPIPHFGLMTTFREIERSERAIASITGRTPYLIRPPYGRITTPLLAYAVMKRRKTVLWSWDSNDSFVTKDADLIEGLDHIVPGDIVLFHDETAVTVRNIDIILATLKGKGFRFVLLDELFWPKVPERVDGQKEPLVQ
jgi:peptidoglycan-N-acetylglucosamine deacetylase